MNVFRPQLVVLIVIGLVPWSGGCQRQSPAAQSATPSGVDRVTLGKPQRKTLTLATVQPGQIEAIEQASLFARVSGYVEKVHVDIGDRVEKDQALVTIAVPELRNELAQKDALIVQAEAEQKQADAAIEGAQASLKSAEAKVVQAQAGVARAEGDLQRWTAEHKRLQELAAGRAVTDKLVDETLNQLRSAEASKQEVGAAVDSAKAFVDEARVKIRSAEADAAAAGARLKVAQANRSQTATLVDFATIKAPFAGTVTRRALDAGHYVSPPASAASASPLLVVSRTDVVRVFVDVPELEAALVTAGQEGDGVPGDMAEIRVQALGAKVTTARVTRTAWSLDTAGRSLRTEIDVPNADGSLRPGMFATTTIVLDERPDVLVLPAAAVVREGTDVFCAVVVDGKIERRKVDAGLRSGAELEIRSGIGPDDAVVVSPVANLKPGQPVEVANPPTK